MKQACVHVRVGMVCPSDPACEVPALPSARGVRLASGRLTRSGRRHGGTESGFEVGLRAVSSTWCPLGRVFFTTEHTETPFGRHRRGWERRCFARSGLFLPCRGTCKTIAIAVATSEPLRKSVNRCCFAKIREVCTCRSLTHAGYRRRD